MKMKKLLLGMTMLCILGILSCSKKETPDTSVEITTLSATHAAKNGIVTITGKNFTTDTTQIVVTINGVRCTIVSASSNAIVIKVPPKCGSGDLIVKINGISSNRLGFIYDWTTTITSLNDGTSGNVDGPLATSKWQKPSGLCIDNSDNIYVCSSENPRVRKISADLSTVTTLAGDGTRGNINAQGTNAKFGSLENITTDINGNVYVADFDVSSVKKIDVLGNVTTFFSVLPTLSAIKIGKLGNIYISNYATIYKFNSSGVLQWKITSHGDGNVDGDSSIVRFTDNVNNGISFSNMAIDNTEQNIYFATINANNSSQIKKLNTNTMVFSTVAGTTSVGSTDGAALNASFQVISGLVLDPSGGLFISDGFNHKIRYLKDGVVSTVIGAAGEGDVDGDASVAKINYPIGIDINSSGEVFVVCAGNNKVKKIVIE